MNPRQEVIEKVEGEGVKCRALNSGRIKNRRGVNVPNSKVRDCFGGVVVVCVCVCVYIYKTGHWRRQPTPTERPQIGDSTTKTHF